MRLGMGIIISSLIILTLALKAPGNLSQPIYAAENPSPSGAPSQGVSSTADWVPYGTTYVWSTDFSDVQGLRSRLQYVHSLGVHTLIQRQILSLPEEQQCLFLDEAHALGIVVIVRLPGTDSRDPPWGWDGEHFDLTPLQTFLDADCVSSHPALLAVYGFHIPWHDFTADEIRQFYTEFHTVAPNIPLYHDLVWVEDPPHSDFSAGMCDLCEVSSMPHTWLDGEPVNNSVHVTEKIVRYTSRIRQADPDAQIWIQAQTFQQRPSFRMPTPDDMLWHARLLMQYVDFDGLFWYPYLHTYEHQLGDEDMAAQRQVVLSVYQTYYANGVYLPLVMFEGE